MKFDHIYMQMAREMSSASKSNRKQVGAILVTPSGVLLPGYNGTPSGWDNRCEDDAFVTKSDVLHSELNCLLKAAKEGVSVVGSTIYITLSPCVQCSAMLAQAGIVRIVYDEEYRIPDGILLLRNHNVICEKLTTV